MQEYPKIDTCFKRDPENLKRLIEGDWANPAFGYLANNRWVFTEKVDGTNIRVIIPHKNADFDPYNESSALERRVAFGGKTDNASIPATLVTHLQNKFLPMSEKLYEMFPDGACLYGEGYGAKIQKGGGNYRSDQSFVLFDVLVYELANDRYWWLE